MKKIFALIVTVCGIAGLVEVLRFQPSSTASLNQTTTPTTQQNQMQGQTAQQNQTVTPTTQSTASTTSYKDGSYTGQSIDVGYGIVQVKAIVQNHQITDVSFLQAPSDRQMSRQISQYAEPILIKEAVQAQTGRVDIVSGATSTSDGYIESLQSALSQAS